MYWKFCIKRLLLAFITFSIVIFIYSFLFNTTMEKTVRSQIDEEIKAEMTAMTSNSSMTKDEMILYRSRKLEEKYKKYNLDKSFIERVVLRAVHTLTFNYGKTVHIRSSRGETSVWSVVMEALPRTLILFGTVTVINLFIGIWLGIIKAQKPGKILDNTTSAATMIVYGMPSWWLGMIAIMFFAYILKWLPSGGLFSTPPFEGFARFTDMLYHMILPVLTLVLIGFWGMAYLIRNIMIGVLQEDYVMTARARGINEKKVLFGHALHSAGPPIVTMAVLSLLASISGNIIFEGIFSWPGLGNLYWIAVETNDIPVLMGALSVTTGLYIAGLAFLDLIYGFLDPRIKIGGTPS